ncbi:MAG: hypothetical protein AAFP03_08210 [Cyanobacteria bacterium J06598_3]
MFYKVCLGLAIGILTLSLVGSFANASSLTLRQQNFVDNRARSRVRTTYIVPVPYGRTYSGGSGGSGSSRSSYDGYRGGGPGSGK